MKTRILLITFVIFAGFVSGHSVYGLSCEPQNITRDFEESDVIFSGKAVSKEYITSKYNFGDGRDDAITKFTINETFKGNTSETIDIVSSEWFWGMNFTEGLEYVVFAFVDDEDELRHQTCTSTDIADDIVLNKIRETSLKFHTLDDEIVIFNRTPGGSISPDKTVYPVPWETRSPLKQFNDGIDPKVIHCNDGLTLIQKHDGSPACVTSETLPKLVERGWGENHNDKITMKDYKIDCNNQTNPYHEYECFKNAYSNCQAAIVNPEIYTIEGDPIYTTLTITSDCKIQGVADMSTDRFWGDPEIITTTCSTITRDEYSWSSDDCDAKNLSEMQFNFMMQMYPQILGCEENGNTWNHETLSCVNGNKESAWKKYITVSAIRDDDPVLADALPVYNADLPNDYILNKLLVGADGCKNETEICKISGGISLDIIYHFLPSKSISENDKYTMTLDKTQAENLLSILNWQRDVDSFYTIIQWEKKQYFLILSTFDDKKIPDVKMNILDSSHEPVTLQPDQTLNYTILVSAWSTYGTDAQIDLEARHNSIDSGIDVWIEPETFYVKERNNATAILLIRAQDDAKDGIYDIRVIGQANGKNTGLYCRSTICPSINIGNSDWSIHTFGSGVGRGIGAGQPTPNTWMEIELNKEEFFAGETTEIKAYLVNNSTEKIKFIPNELLITVIKAEPVGYYENLFGIDARYESDKPIVLEPNSKTILVRPFYWNQTTFHDIDEQQRLEPKQYKMISRFVGGNQTWDDDVWFEVK